MTKIRLLASVLLAAIVAVSLIRPAVAGPGKEAFERGDYGAALMVWQPYADQGSARAQYNISILYENGLGVKKDPETALKWMSLAAEGGYLNAQKRLAVIHDTGENVPKDPKQAHKWYLATALQGDVRAQRRLGFMYASGEGVPQDMAQGYMWLWVAAEAGDTTAKKSFDLLAGELEPEQINSGKELVTAWLDNRRATD